MAFSIDVSQNILLQFATQFGTSLQEGQLQIPKEWGSGGASFLALPQDLELYHFNFNLAKPFALQSFNPLPSDWLLLNINLSIAKVTKKVNDQSLEVQKFLPSGMLLYSPQTEVSSRTPAGQAFQIVLLRFSRTFLQSYLGDRLALLQGSPGAIIYEDLDVQSENLLRKALIASAPKMEVHAYLLQFLARFFAKIQKRASASHYEQLHPTDLKNLFIAAAHLRNPLLPQLPTVDDLAQIAQMGKTKFKTSFKQVFGLAPIQYHQKIKMDYARQALEQKRQTPSELSYELGYSHPSKFTNAYKKQFGLLPSET